MRAHPPGTDGMCCGSMLCMRVHIPTAGAHSPTDGMCTPSDSLSGRTEPHRARAAALCYASGYRWHVLRLYAMRAATIGTGTPTPGAQMACAHHRTQERLQTASAMATGTMYHTHHRERDSAPQPLPWYTPHSGRTQPHSRAHRSTQHAPQPLPWYTPTDSLSTCYRHRATAAKEKQQKAAFVTAFVAILLLFIFLHLLNVLYISHL